MTVPGGSIVDTVSNKMIHKSIYILPVEKRMGKAPVWSKYVLISSLSEDVSNIEHRIFFVFVLLDSYVGWRSASGIEGECCHIERRFFCSCSRGPLMLSSIGGKCLEIWLAVRPGNERKWCEVGLMVSG